MHYDEQREKELEKEQLKSWLMQGDCLERMKEIPDGSVDMILTDPPYGMKYKRHIKKPRFDKIMNDNNLQWLPAAMDEIKRILTKNGNMYIFCSWHNCDIFKHELQKRFHLKNMLIWNKGGNGMGDLRTDYGGVYEVVFFVVNNTGNQRALNGKRDSNIINFSRSGNKLHPTEKPVDMMEYLISKSTDENQTILDPFMGSGSTGVACKSLNRSFIGIELDEEYFKIAQERISAT